VYRVVDNRELGVRQFYSGTTIHGSERLTEFSGALADSMPAPLAYYHRQGPLGSLFAARSWHPGPWRVGAIGLGAGASATYARPGESWTFFEIDPLVADIAENERYFRFVSSAKAPQQIMLGDARLSIASEPPRSYDVLLVDAFSSDAIPVHLITREALALYRSKLAPDGMIAWHISNKYLDLRPVLAALARDARMHALIDVDVMVGANAGGRLPSIWVAITARDSTAAAIAKDPKWQPLRVRRERLWTDDFSNLLSVLK
jgi:spermidine synthase